MNRIERPLVADRVLKGVPTGGFDRKHLRAIHRHLFQDLHDWAGKLRTLDTSKAGSHLHDFRRPDLGIDQVHGSAKAVGTGRSLPRVNLALKLVVAIGDLSYVHPFGDGYGRAQLQYARPLAERAGHRLDVSRLPGLDWIRASAEAMEERGNAMLVCFNEALRPRGKQAPHREP